MPTHDQFPFSQDLQVRSLVDYYNSRPYKIGDNLLGNGFLIAGDGLVFAGPACEAKTYASVHQDIMWALGEPAFGIEPARPLKILIIERISLGAVTINYRF